MQRVDDSGSPACVVPASLHRHPGSSREVLHEVSGALVSRKQLVQGLLQSWGKGVCHGFTRYPCRATLAHVLQPRRTEGSRAEHVATLNRLAEGFWHLGNDRLADASRAGAERLKTGETSIRVGHTEYIVTDDE